MSREGVQDDQSTGQKNCAKQSLNFDGEGEEGLPCYLEPTNLVINGRPICLRKILVLHRHNPDGWPSGPAHLRKNRSLCVLAPLRELFRRRARPGAGRLMLNQAFEGFIFFDLSLLGFSPPPLSTLNGVKEVSRCVPATTSKVGRRSKARKPSLGCAGPPSHAFFRSRYSRFGTRPLCLFLR